MFWVGRPEYVAVSLLAAAVVWIVGPRRFRGSILTWLDAVGMAAYTVVGALKAISLGVPTFSALVMDVLTATFGGVIRDVLAHEPPVLLQREFYVTPALAGAGTFVVLELVDTPAIPAGVAGFVMAFSHARRRDHLEMVSAGLRRAGGRLSCCR